MFEEKFKDWCKQSNGTIRKDKQFGTVEVECDVGGWDTVIYRENNKKSTLTVSLDDEMVDGKYTNFGQKRGLMYVERGGEKYYFNENGQVR